MSIGPEGGFEEVVSDVSQRDKDDIAESVLEDMGERLNQGGARLADVRAGEMAVEELMGECDYPKYCKFYGENPGFCGRTCSMSVWDQI